ncbi:hypothetical protein KQR57_05535 [Bacillus inaquosorum]|nr:hypothetical protein [Bacillus inaquosorum]
MADMDTKAIFRALQAGDITVQHAYDELASFLNQSQQVEGEDRGKLNDEEKACQCKIQWWIFKRLNRGLSR